MVSILLSKDSTLKIISEIKPEVELNKKEESSFAQTSFIVNSRLTDKNKGIISKFSSYYAESCNFTYQQPEKAAELLVKHGFYPKIQIALRSIPLCNINFRYAAEVKKEINQYLSIFYTFEPKSIGGKMPDDNFIYADISE